MKRARGLLVLLALAGACSAPAPRTVEAARAPAAWSAPEAAPGAPEREWWRSFGDPVLAGLVERALAANLDLELARSRVREARADWRAAGGVAEPRLDLVAGYARSQPSRNTPQGALAGENDLWQAGFDARWELDFFGRNAALVAAARHGVETAEYALADAQVALLAELARNYFELCGTGKELEVLRANVELQRDTLALTRSRLQAGLATGLDEARAETQLAGTESLLPTLEARRRSGQQRIAVLLGELPESLPPGLEQLRALPEPPATLVAGTPSELLLRRADVRAAERNVARFQELARAAEADLCPRVTLQAALGSQSSEFWNVLDSASRSWSIGPALVLPLFDRGALRAAAEAADERAQQALVAYQRTVLTAFAEVEDALTALARERERAQKLAQALAASERALGYADELQLRGLVDFFQVIDAQRARLLADSELAQSRTALAQKTVALYKALGGGWETAAAPR